MARALPTGITRDINRRGVWIGYRVFQWVPHPAYPNGKIQSERFPLSATLDEMTRWRENQKVLARQRETHAETPNQEATGFLADADRYLETVSAMPSWKERRREMRAWVAVFGEQPTDTMTATPIRAARDRWLTVGPKLVQERQPDGTMRYVPKPIGLAPQSVNLRLRALENFFTVMYPGRPNPVREVPECTGPHPEPRGETFALALEILSYMPDITTPAKGGVAEVGSKTRARFAVMILTGLPAIQVGRLKPDHIDWPGLAFAPPKRAKGRVGKRQRGRAPAPKMRPLLPQAIPALEQLFALGANTPFQSSSMTRSVRAAIAQANRVRARKRLPLIPAGLRVYDLTRHTFGTELYRATKNVTHVQALLGHSDGAMSQRYAMAAIREDLTVGMSALEQRLPRGKVRGKVSPPKPSRSVRTGRKRLTRNTE